MSVLADSNNINFKVCCPHSFITIRVCLIKPNSGDAQYVHLEQEGPGQVILRTVLW